MLLLDQFECEIGWSFDGNNCSQTPQKQSLVSLKGSLICVVFVYVFVFKYSVT